MRKSGSRKQAEITNAAKSLKGVNYQGTLISKKDFKEVIETAKNTAKDQGGTLSEEEIIEGFATKFIADKKAPDGEYVVGDAIISIKDGKVVPGSVRR
jgi:hydroxylamine reductase (hybrid-cluster protein)